MDAALGCLMQQEPPHHALIHDHLHLVRHIAGRVARRYRLDIDRDELVSYGLLGLVEAAHRFDPSKGHRFVTFAYPRITGAIIDGLGALGPLPRPRRRAHEPVRGSDREASVPCHEPRCDDKLIGAESASSVRAALTNLPARTRYLLERRYWDARTLTDIGKELGLSKSRASRLHSQALRLLRSSLGEAA